MADVESENKAMQKTSKRLEDEATKSFNSFIAFLLLIGDSDSSKSEKLRLISSRVKDQKEWIDTFSNTQLPKVYNRQAKAAYKQLGKRSKNLSAGQTNELNNQREDLINSLNQKLNDYTRMAYRLVLMRELEKIREKRLGYDDATQRRVINRTKFKREIVFMDSKGRKIKTNAIMAIIVGDSVWKAMFSARTSVWLSLGVKYGIHRSVIDNRTTPICRALDGKRRDLRKDKLPPIHIRCRSSIEIIK